MKQFKTLLIFIVSTYLFILFHECFDIEQVKVNPSMMGDYSEKFEGM